MMIPTLPHRRQLTCHPGKAEPSSAAALSQKSRSLLWDGWMGARKRWERGGSGGSQPDEHSDHILAVSSCAPAAPSPHLTAAAPAGLSACSRIDHRQNAASTHRQQSTPCQPHTRILTDTHTAHALQCMHGAVMSLRKHTPAGTGSDVRPPTGGPPKPDRPESMSDIYLYSAPMPLPCFSAATQHAGSKGDHRVIRTSGRPALDARLHSSLAGSRFLVLGGMGCCNTHARTDGKPGTPTRSYMTLSACVPESWR